MSMKAHYFINQDILHSKKLWQLRIPSKNQIFLKFRNFVITAGGKLSYPPADLFQLRCVLSCFYENVQTICQS